MSYAYRPDRFTGAYTQLDGPALWRWLNHPRQIEVMETASYLRRPAVEALSPHLARAFPDHINVQIFRQMVGHMARQVLEHRGLTMDRAKVRIRIPGNLFHCGTSFRIAA